MVKLNLEQKKTIIWNYDIDGDTYVDVVDEDWFLEYNPIIQEEPYNFQLIINGKEWERFSYEALKRLDLSWEDFIE